MAARRQPKDVRALLPFNSEQTTLDDDTLDSIRAFLASPQMRAPLVEEEVSTRTFKISQYASERTRYRENLWEGSDMAYDHSIFDIVYKEEEEYALGNEFFKTVVTESSHAMASAARDSNYSRKHQLEPRTIKWLKKATGLQKPHDPLDQKSHLLTSDEDIGLLTNKTGNQRRLTRGMVRDTRVKRQEERQKQENVGMESLLAAVEEIEQERGVSFNIPSGNQKVGNKKRREADKPHLVAKIPISRRRDKFKLMVVSRVIVNGKAIKVDQAMADARNRDDDSLLSEGGWKSRKRTIAESSFDYYSSDDYPSDDTGDFFKRGRILKRLDRTTLHRLISQPSPSSPFPLRLLDLQRRIGLKKDENEIDFPKWAQENKDTTLGALKEHGIVPRLPRWKELQKYYGSSPRKPEERRYPSESEILDERNQKSRRWARHEFFYSDIDRLWYSSNDFDFDVVGQGMLPITHFSAKPWKMARKKMRNRPRRFSRNFIASEIKKRDHFRNSLRQLQKNPDTTSQPCPIKSGSVVLVYSQRRRDLQRGTVLYYDDERHGYFVHYAKKMGDSGYEFCDDFHLAVQNTTEKAVSSADPETQQSFVADAQGKSDSLSSSDHSIASKVVTKDEVLVQWLTMRPKTNSSAVGLQKNENTEGIALNEKRHREIVERETLMSLMATLEAATKRKEAILDALESFNGNNPPDTNQFHDTDESISTQHRSHYAWLLANLDSVNKTIEEAAVYLRVMYGKIYHKRFGQNKHHQVSKIEEDIWKVCRAASDSKISPLSWTDVVALDSGDVARSLALCCQESNSKEQVTTKIAKPVLVSSALSFLCAAEFCCLSATSEKHVPSMNEMEVALNAELQDLLKPFTDLSGIPQDGVLNCLDSETMQAVNDLIESTTMFKRELLATCATQLLQSSNP